MVNNGYFTGKHTQPRSGHNRRGDRHRLAHSAYVTKDKPVTEERFAALVQDRLAAVIKDREAMTKKVRERARQQIMVSQFVFGSVSQWLECSYSYTLLGLSLGTHWSFVIY